MRLPSFVSIWNGFSRVLKRFPLQLLVVFLATVSSCYLIELKHENYDLTDDLSKFLAVCNIAFVWLLAADLFTEATESRGLKKALIRLGILSFCALSFFTLQPTFYEAHLYKLLLLALAGHLLVSFAAFPTKGLTNAFWQFNKSLFLRLATAGLYTLVLFAGLAMALFALNNLFSLHMPDRYYRHLFVLLGIGFNTIFFLAGVPDGGVLPEEQEEYPKGLKIFTQYVLIPLMSIYLLILSLYEIKIVLAWELPKGLVSSLIIGYAFFGLLSLLLIFPIRDTEGNRWVKFFSRFFYWAMIPLLILLAMAIYTRVGNYGLTEPRYFLICIALWLSFITTYFLLNKQQNIKVIPISLCIITILTIYGPQSAFNISKNAQIARLQTLQAEDVDENDEEKASIIRYLVKFHGLDALQVFTAKDLRKIEHDLQKNRSPAPAYTIVNQKVDTAYTLLDVNPNKSFQKNASYNVSIVHEQVSDVQDWEYLISMDNYQQELRTKVGNDSIIIQKNGDQQNCSVQIGEESHVFEFDRLINEIDSAYQQKALAEKKDAINHFYYPPDRMQQSGSIGHYTVSLLLTNLQISYNRSLKNELPAYTTFRINLKLRKVD